MLLKIKLLAYAKQYRELAILVIEADMLVVRHPAGTEVTHNAPVATDAILAIKSSGIGVIVVVNSVSSEDVSPTEASIKCQGECAVSQYVHSHQCGNVKFVVAVAVGVHSVKSEARSAC